ncbi:MAG: PocR ligand-binding domain-containing protein [Kiritimatiellae bacterium]|nr:PocR ligand-binding domain-containing protein [Kiritimatiellia bacterium]
MKHPPAQTGTPRWPLLRIEKLKTVADYHEIVFRLTGLPIDFAYPDGETLRLCPYSHFRPFCRMVRATPEGGKACRASDAAAVRLAETHGEPLVYTCHAGLTDIVVPLFIGGVFLGCFTSGQFLMKKPTARFLARTAKALHHLKIGDDRLRRCLNRTLVFNRQQVEAVVQLIQLIGSFVLEHQDRLLFLKGVQERDKISLAKAFMERRYGDKIAVADIAAAVGLSPSRLSHLFRRETGATMVQCLNRLRVEKARDLLRNSKLRVTEIAFETGFQSPTHFNRIFRAIAGCSPSAWREG